MKTNLIYLTDKANKMRFNYACCASLKETKKVVKMLEKDMLISKIYNIHFEKINIPILKTI